MGSAHDDGLWYAQQERLRAAESIEAERVREVNQSLSLDQVAFQAAWRAFQHTDIDLVADSDDEQCRCLGNAIKAYITSFPFHNHNHNHKRGGDHA